MVTSGDGKINRVFVRVGGNIFKLVHRMVRTTFIGISSRLNRIIFQPIFLSDVGICLQYVGCRIHMESYR